MNPDFVRAEIQWRTQGAAPARYPIVPWLRSMCARIRKGVRRG